MIASVYYMRPDWFRDGITGSRPDPANLSATHVHLKDVAANVCATVDETLEGIWRSMQAEAWSSNGEARSLIEEKGLAHTSMSIGDVIVLDGRTFLAARAGFHELIAIHA